MKLVEDDVAEYQSDHDIKGKHASNVRIKKLADSNPEALRCSSHRP